MVSLIELIRKGSIPYHQFMDLETITWIKKNRPSFNIDLPSNFNLKLKIENSITEVKRYIPDTSWFLISKKSDSIHGMRHILRVMFLTYLLNSLNQKNSVQLFRNSLVASSLHDLRRKNDLMDLHHGKKAARFFKNNLSLIEDQYKIKLSQNDIEHIFYAISFHNITYNKLKKNVLYKKYKVLTDILKTADALDRYRLPSLRLWFKDDYVSFIPPEYLKCIAFQLVVSSEFNFLNGLTNTDSVLIALTEFFK